MFLFKLSARDMVVLSLLILASIFVFVQIAEFQKHDNLIEVSIEEGETKQISFENLSMVPGKSTSYTLRLTRGETLPCDFTFKFEEMKEQELKKYLYVRIESGGEVLCDELLADLFDEKQIAFHIDPDAGQTNEMKITYYILSEVGNEAQRARVDFDLFVSATTLESIEGGTE